MKKSKLLALIVFAVSCMVGAVTSSGEILSSDGKDWTVIPKESIAAVTASTYDGNDRPENVIGDGTWQAIKQQDGRPTDWIMIEFRESVNVGPMMIEWQADCRPHSYTLYGLTDISGLFEEVKFGTDNGLIGISFLGEVPAGTPCYTYSVESATAIDNIEAGDMASFKDVKYLLLYADKASYDDYTKIWGSHMYNWKVSDADTHEVAKLTFDNNGPFTVAKGESVDVVVSSVNKYGENSKEVTEGLTFSVVPDAKVTADYSDGKWHVTIDNDGVFSLTVTDGTVKSESVPVTVFPDMNVLKSVSTSLYNDRVRWLISPYMKVVSQKPQANMFDGDFATSFVSADNILALDDKGGLDTEKNWIIVDLGEDFNIDMIDFYSDNATIGKYEIDFLSGSNASTMAQASHSDEWSGTRSAAFETLGEGSHCLTYLETPGRARFVRFTIKELGVGAGLHYNLIIPEIQIYDKSVNDFDTLASLGIANYVIKEGQTKDLEIVPQNRYGAALLDADGKHKKVVLSDVKFDIVPGEAATIEGKGTNNVKVTHEGSIEIDKDAGKFAGLKAGVVELSYEYVGKGIAVEEGHRVTGSSTIEVTIDDWSKVNNIAKSFDKTREATVYGKNTHGNPTVSLTTNIPREIDGTSYDAHLFNNGTGQGVLILDAKLIKALDDDKTFPLREPWISLDLGDEFEINAFEIGWVFQPNCSVFMSPGEVPGWMGADGKIDSGKLEAYRVYDLTPATSEDWKEPTGIDNTYREGHAIKTRSVRHMLVRFHSANMWPRQIQLYSPKMEDPANARRLILMATPQFDRSEVADRTTNHDYVVTSVHRVNTLPVSFDAYTQTGEEWYRSDSQRYKVIPVLEEVEGQPFSGGSFGEVQDERRWRDQEWNVYLYQPKTTGQAKVWFKVEDMTGEYPDIESSALTVHTVTDTRNIAPYAEASDNAVVYDGTNGATSDRDSGNATPDNAIDGNLGSWYVVGYRGESLGDAAGYDYKYPGGQHFGGEGEPKPYELDLTFQEGIYATRLDQINILWEGAYASDYEVYVRHADPAADGAVTGDWELIGTFSDMQYFGVGQVEAHVLYNNEGGVISNLGLENIKSVKIRMLRQGTQWGLKIWEVSMLGELNQSLLPLEAYQARYDKSDDTRDKSKEDGGYLSFDVKLSMPFGEDEMPKTIDKVKTYEIEMSVPENAMEKDVPVSWSTVGGERHMLGNTYGTYDYNHAARKARILVAANEDGTMPDIFMDNMHPGWECNFKATAIDADGDPVPGIESGMVNGVRLSMPTVTYDATVMNIEAIKETLPVDAAFSHQPLGSSDDVPAYSTRASRVSTTNGYFSQIPLTDRTLRDWEVKLHMDLTFADPTDGGGKKTFSYEYAFNNLDNPYEDNSFAALNDPEGTAANIGYLPLPVMTKKAGSLDLNGINNAPDDLKDQDVTVATGGLSLVIDTETWLYVTRKDKNPIVNETSSMVKSADVNNRVTLNMESGWQDLMSAPDNVRLDKMAIQTWSKNTWGGGKYVDAFPVIKFTGYDPENDTAALPRAVGFYASNGRGHNYEDYGADCDLGGGVAGGEVNAEGQGYATGYYIPGYSKYEADGDYDASLHNYAEIAAKAGHLALRVHHVDDGTGVKTDANGKVTATDKIPSLYTLLLNEYPVSLAREYNDEGVIVLDEARPAVTVDTELRAPKATRASFAANGDGDGYIDGDVNDNPWADLFADKYDTTPLNAVMGAIGTSRSYGTSFQSVAAPALLVQPFDGTTTALDATLADKGAKLRIYPNPVADFMMVEGVDAGKAVAIHSIDGHCVMSTEMPESCAGIAVSALVPGYYVVRCGDASAIMIKK